MMRGGRPRQRFRGALPEEPLHPEPLGADAREVEVGRARSGDDDEVDPHRHQIGVGAEALTAEPLHAVSLHGTPDAATHDQAEPGRPGDALSGEQEREMSGPHAPRVAIALGARELDVPADSAIGAEGHITRPAARGRAPVYFL
jgi:hypothetical protein